MRSSAGIVAGLFLIGLVANCGGDDSGGTSNPTAGTTSSAGEGGENTGATSAGGTNATAGTNAKAGEGGMAQTGCTKDAECGATAKCVDGACLKNDGEACTEKADCQNNCIDSVCTSKLEDGKDCTADDDCVHTCIDNVCGPASDVGGDCDVDLSGAGGAGGDGAGGNASVAAGGDGGAGPSAPQARDCIAPLQCFAGKCLTPDGEACKENVDCVNTCNKSVCEPKQGLNGPCDDNSDCISDAFICDSTSKTCKLDLKQQCNDNAQCQSNRCICADDTCTTRTCKTATSVCQCRWSPADSASCDNTSASLKLKAQDPNGCDGSKMCNGSGLCITNTAGDCQQKCRIANNGPDGYAGTADDICTQFQTATGCNAGYHGEIVANGDCAAIKTGTTFTDSKGTHYNATCQATCSCELN